MRGRAGGQPSFQTTSWTLLEGLHADDEQDRQASLELLAQVYWPPIYSYIRRCGRSPEEAADLTQGFFSDVIMNRRLFALADQDRGRLRDLIRRALGRYLIDAHRAQRVPKTGRLVPLGGQEREERLLARDDSQDHNQAFDRRWALLLLQEAIRRTEAHFRAAGKEGHWRAFEERVLQPAIHLSQSPPLADLAHAHDFASPADVSAALQVVKKRLKAILQQVSAETGADEDSLPGEV